MNRSAGLCLAFATGVALLAGGCPNPNTYTTPRTAGAGKFTNSIAPEVWGFTGHAAGGDSLTATVPVLPTYTLRIGIADPLDIGLKIANLSSVGADIKWNFLRSSKLDLAIDPGVQYFSLGSVSEDNGNSTSLSVAYIHVPILVGINLSRTLSVILAPGISWAHASAGLSSGSSRDEASATSGALARLGLGLDIRINPRFALHPELTVIRTVTADNSLLLYMLGVGFNFGSLPNYDDVE